MTADSAWRVALARNVATYYAGQAGVAMIVLGGSAAQGRADAYSDIDMLVYWNQVDDGWLEQPPLTGPAVKRFTYRVSEPGKVVLEQYFLGDAKLDVGHISLGWWEDQVQPVLAAGEITPATQEMLVGFLSAVVLTGEDVYRQWYERVAAYPESLAQRMVEAHLFFYPLWVLEQQGLARDDLLNFYDILTRMTKNLMGVLAGLNRVYLSIDHPKHLVATLAQMRVAPEGVAQRLPALLRMPREEVPGALGSLIEETLTLVERYMPMVDTTRARRTFTIEVRPCTTPPSFPAAG